MKAIYKISIIVIGLLIFYLPSMVSADTYGDITCTEKFIPVHKFECRRPDMSLEKVFQTYDQMSAWYSPPRIETYISETIWVYGTPTENI